MNSHELIHLKSKLLFSGDVGVHKFWSATFVDAQAFIRVCDRLDLVPSAEAEALAQETAPNIETRRNQKVSFSGYNCQ